MIVELNVDFQLIVNLLAILVNVILVFVITLQYKSLQNQFINLNRPWVHLYVEENRVKSALSLGSEFMYYYPLIIENFGNTTAINIKVESPDEKMRKEFSSNTVFNSFNFNSFYPNQKKILLKTVSGIIDDHSEIIPIVLKYEFSNKKIVKRYYLIERFSQDPELLDVDPFNFEIGVDFNT